MKISQLLFRIFFVFTLLLWMFSVAFADIIYVDAGAVGLNNGSSWEDAYLDLQDALAAAVSGDEIWVAAGTYKPTSGTDQNVAFVMKNGVAIYGGFAGTETSLAERDWEANVTILSGNIGEPDDVLDNSHSVILNAYDDVDSLDGSAILDGFTIADAHGSYGAMKNVHASPTVRNCTFIDNTFGGAVYNFYSAPVFENCLFVNNTGSFGGGISNVIGASSVLTDCEFVNNEASYGGGIYASSAVSLELTRCVFRNNVSYNDGGGVYIDGCAEAVIEGCEFIGNMAEKAGGGCRILGASAHLENTFFSGNFAGEQGGAVYANSGDCYLINCGLWGNEANQGGAIYADNSIHLRNCSLSGNAATQDGGGLFVSGNQLFTVFNCIFWGNSTEISATWLGGIVLNSIIQGGYNGGEFIQNADPLFVAQPPIGLGFDGDLHILPESPAIDKGTFNDAPFKDIDGQQRPFGIAVDIGFDEVDVPVATRELALEGTFTLSPNPAVGESRLHYDLPAAAALKVRVTDALGRLVRTYALPPAQSGDLLIDLSDLAATEGGQSEKVYYVSITDGELSVGRVLRLVGY